MTVEYDVDVTTEQTRDVHPTFVQCWASVADSGPMLDQLCVNVSCLLGAYRFGLEVCGLFNFFNGGC